MEEIETKDKRKMWPSFELASSLYYYANIFLIIALIGGVISTVVIVWMGNVKEDYLNQDLEKSKAETAKLMNSNLALEKVIQPRRISTISITTTSALQKFLKNVVRVNSYGGDAESAILGTQILEFLTSAGFTPQNNLMSYSSMGQLTFGILVSGSNQQLVDALVSALKSWGLSDVYQSTPPQSVMALTYSEPNADAMIFVALKPIQLVSP